MKLLIVCALIVVAATAPGLLRVPKVYNAVITSNQNLSPSRAIPVIQPIIQRTAYVPPIYYTQITPHSVVHYSALSGGEILGNDQAQAPSSRLVESTSFGIAKERATTERYEDDSRSDDSKSDDLKNDSTKNDSTNNFPKKSEPLSFYPNYRSRYYVPYVYTYNSFNPHFVPGTYYIDYELFSTVEPIPATNPKKTSILLPSFHDEKRTKNDNKQTIPDVPPPPLPTSVPKS